MPFFGGSKAATEIHNRVVEKLQSEFGYGEEEARAIKSILYDMAKDAEKKGKKTMTGVDKAKIMEKHLTKKFIKDNITKNMVEDRIQKIHEQRESRKAAQAAGTRRKKSSKKSSKRRKTSHKKSSIRKK